MRLLKTRTELPELEDFAADDIPLYAVLSHTWEKDEISFQDIQAIQRGDTAATRKPEYHKIAMTRAVAAAHGFDYVWIDTCCIDKMSSAELSEAINSMYRWYQEAAMCYAHLTDVTAVNKELAASRWFTRGWTLQELIAPSMMVFLNTAWEEIGTKSDLGPVISKITRIPEAILQGAADLETASIAQRMSWAANRKTTRPEDIAYCLMGLFGVNMPMLYGEGEKAFIRLQEEIMKISSDHTLFAWGNRIQHI
ncbi:heterokaryon incompatibility protein-domain-containing protein, partial [Cercophora newfieldiana]